jgi:hypothetical protein
MKKVSAFIVAFVAFLIFPLSAFAAGGTFTASSYSYDTNSHQLIFHGNNFSPDNANWWRFGICNIPVSGQNALTDDTHCAYSGGNHLTGNDLDVSVTLTNGLLSLNSGNVYIVMEDYNTGQEWLSQSVSDLFSGSPTPTPTATPTPTNQPPVVDPISNATINEGATYSASGSFTDTDSTSWTATVDYGDNSGTQSLILSGTNFSLSHVYQDNGTYTVTISVTDNQGATGTGTATITVNNVAPTVGTITAPSSPVLVNTAMTASANFTDPGVLDTHTASWNWGDGNTTTGTVTESNGSGSVSNSHTYTATGVYMITLTVTDKDGGVGTSTFQYVSVYDSNSSFAGGRSFDNPTSASPSTSGKVSFGISAKYNNSNVLTGSAKMDFKTASLDFASTSLSSLATSNGKAYLKGSGTLNGNSGYTFLASGIDGSVAGGNDLIRFQIKDSSNNVVYDSQPGVGDTTDPTTLDATGNIRVH